jgi:hypothetical protein
MKDMNIEREQKLLDDLGNIMEFETVQARSIRILNKIFEDLEKEIEKEEQKL